MAETPPHDPLAEALERLADEIARTRQQTEEERRELRDCAKCIADLASALNENLRVQDRDALMMRGDINGIMTLLAAIPGATAALPPPREHTGSVALVAAPEDELERLPPQGLVWNVGSLPVPVGKIGAFVFRLAIPGSLTGAAVHFLLEFVKHHVH